MEFNPFSFHRLQLKVKCLGNSKKEDSLSIVGSESLPSDFLPYVDIGTIMNEFEYQKMLETNGIPL